MTQWIVAVVACFFALFTLAHAQEAEHDPSFTDRFGMIDHSRWSIADGWSSADWMSSIWRRKQVRETPDALIFTLSKAPEGSAKPYEGAEMRTKVEMRYGYFETRMRVPKGSGIITGFFTYVGGEGAVKPQELDIEILGVDTHTAELNIHSSGKTESIKKPLGFDASADFHTYGIEWRRDRVRWYVDGKRVHEMRGKKAPIPTRAQTLYIDLWNSERLLGWSGGIKPGQTGPWELHIKCIAYARSYAGKPLCTK